MSASFDQCFKAGDQAHSSAMMLSHTLIIGDDAITHPNKLSVEGFGWIKPILAMVPETANVCCECDFVNRLLVDTGFLVALIRDDT